MNKNEVTMQLYTTRKFQPYEPIFKFLSDSGIENIEQNENSIQCKVELVEPMGADTLVWTSVEGNPISIRLEGSSNFNLNDEISISFDINKSSIFDSKSEERI